MKTPLALVILFYSFNILFSQSGNIDIEGNLTMMGRISAESDTNNIFIGHRAGIMNVDEESEHNVFIGHLSGEDNTTGKYNLFLGSLSGKSNISGNGNVYVGFQTGLFATDAVSNVAIGQNSCYSLTSGINNVTVGNGAAYRLTDGESNVHIGAFSGFENENGEGNIFIGYNSGRNELGNNKLYIENSLSSEPLIYGEFDTDHVQVNGSFSVTDFIKLIPGSAPLNPELGTVYYDASDNKVKVWTGVWENLN